MENLESKFYEFSVEDALSYKETTSLNEKVLVYKREVGLHRRFWIKYESNGPLYNIKHVYIKHKQIVYCDIDNSSYEKRIRIYVNIPKGLNKGYNFKETLIIYTDYDVREFSFYIECEEGSLNNNIIRLEENLYLSRSEENLINIVSSLQDIDEILDVAKKAPEILRQDISMNTYLKIIKRCKEISPKDIKLSLFCEEFLKDRKVITSDIVESIKVMYQNALVTKNTMDVIKYLRLTCSNDRELNFALLRVKAKLKIIDNEFIKEFINLYKEVKDKRSLDKILNVILYCDNVKYSDELIKIVFEFYRRNNDVKSLITVCRELRKKKISLEQYGMNIKDRNLLVKAYRKDILIDWKELLGYLDGYYNRSIYIRDVILRIFEDKLLNGKEKDKKFIYSKYSHIVKDLSRYSRNIYKEYINYMLSAHYKNDEEKMIILQNYLNNFKDTMPKEKRNEITKRIANFYIAKGNKDKYMDIIKKNKLYLKDIIYENILNVDFLGELLITDLISDMKLDTCILNDIANTIIRNRKYNLLIPILDKYKALEVFDSNLFKVFKSFIINFNFISNSLYENIVFHIYYKLSLDSKERIYKLLVRRKDLPIYFREENYNDFRIYKDRKVIIDSFLNGENRSLFSKELCLNEYFDDDDIFLKALIRGEENDEILNIVIEKLSKKFEEDKDYVLDIISNIKNKNKKIKDILTYTKDYIRYKKDDKLSYVFGSFKVIDRNFGEVCDNVVISNIFTEKIENGYLFKNEGIKIVIKKYLKNSNLAIREIDSKIIIIDSEVKTQLENETMLSFMKNIINIIMLQQGLILNGGMIIDFRKDSFIYLDDLIFPKQIENILIYRKEFISRNNSIFDNKKIIENENGRLVVNEKNIVNLIKYYIYRNIDRFKLEEGSNEERIKNIIMKNIIQSKEICTYGELKNSVKEILKDKNEEFKEYKYSKYLDDFRVLKDNFKEKVLEIILNRGDIRKKAKDVAIYYDLEVNIKEEYFKYLLTCFNNHYFDLDREELQEIYERIVSMIKEDESITHKFQDELTEFFLNAPNRCEYSSLEVLLEAKSLDGAYDIEYVEDKIVI